MPVITRAAARRKAQEEQRKLSKSDGTSSPTAKDPDPYQNLHVQPQRGHDEAGNLAGQAEESRRPAPVVAQDDVVGPDLHDADALQPDPSKNGETDRENSSSGGEMYSSANGDSRRRVASLMYRVMAVPMAHTHTDAPILARGHVMLHRSLEPVSGVR
ncbi:uncharacterized protein AB675_8824 [Cyphellophora attinorum]|uniref:Uncharacterized protein n=1 Tax=Cyphellophora attinorum TaxID=1664694 RepID=A0A0N1P337_9EURO|nr:uncharacterized protein AB675_8824 [Phialophora attinorum]KPI44715.1 hypothetical protein AB675_8824 [Phialophora attinorum]